MIAMIAVSWAVSTVISIPPLFGLKDPMIDEHHIHNFSDNTGTLPDAVGGGSFNPPVIEKSGWNHALIGNDGRDQPGSTGIGWLNETVALKD